MAVIKKFQNNFTAGVLSPGVQSRTDLAKYSSGCKRIVNGIVLAHGGITNRPGTALVDEIPGDGILIPFVYSVTQTYALCFYNDGTDVAKMRIYKEGGVVSESGVPVVIPTPYKPSELTRLKFAQSADTMFIAHPSHKPTTLTRSSHTTWTFKPMSFLPDIAAPQELKAETRGFTDESGTYYEVDVYYKVAAVSKTGSESIPSAAATAKILSTWPAGARVTLTWSAVSGAVRYEVYKNDKGFYEWIGSADSTRFIDNNIEGDPAKGPKENRDPFASAGNYPGVVGIYQQRLIFGRSNLQPQTVWCSETGDFDSMAVAQPLRDDSAITATVDSRQMNEIRHFIPLRDMLMLTSGAEFKMSSGGQSNAITPTAINFAIQSYWGASDVPPVVSGTSIVIVTNDGRHVRDLHYQLSEDGYAGNEVSILAEHLIDSEVRDWAFQQSPYSTIWVILNNGRLLTFTYMREQEIWAWSEHQSPEAAFRSVTSIREGAEDNVYFLVKRSGKFYVEYQVRRHYGDAVEDSFFVDCGLQYTGAAVSTVEGLEHLVGKEVVALADGSVVRGLTVSADGKITLPAPAKKVTVGLPYTMLIETLDQEVKGQDGTALGEQMNIPQVVFQMRESRSIEVGPTEEDLVTIKFPVPDMYGAPPPLFTGEIKTSLPGRHRTETSIVFRQKDPLPATVLSVVTHISVR